VLTPLSRDRQRSFRVQIGRPVADALSRGAPAACLAAPRRIRPGAGGQPAVLTGEQASIEDHAPEVLAEVEGLQRAQEALRERVLGARVGRPGADGRARGPALVSHENWSCGGGLFSRENNDARGDDQAPALLADSEGPLWMLAALRERVRGDRVGRRGAVGRWRGASLFSGENGARAPLGAPEALSPEGPESLAGN
jgi:hypothetical protein